MTPILISLLQADVRTWHNDALLGNIFISVENSSPGLCDRLLTPRWTAACTLGPVRLVKDSCGRMEAGREKHGLTMGFTVLIYWRGWGGGLLLPMHPLPATVNGQNASRRRWDAVPCRGRSNCHSSQEGNFHF